jgi:hypothetical protein
VTRTSSETSLAKRTPATERKTKQNVEEMKTEQEIGTTTGEKAADENQIVRGIGTIRA